MGNGQSKPVAFTDDAEVQIHNLASWQRDAAKDIEVHGIALEAARTDLSKANESIESAADSLEGLKIELNAERDSLTKVASRVDQCYKYFNGLGKGLQETHRQILNTDGGMTLPLPSLPTAPRTPKARLPSPRRSKPI